MDQPQQTSQYLVYAFGYGKHGQLGLSLPLKAQEFVSSPTVVDAFDELDDGRKDPVIDVVCGGSFTCALTKRGQIFEWGESRSPTPTKAVLDKQWTDVAVGHNSTLAQTKNGDVYSWDSVHSPDSKNNVSLSAPIKIDFPQTTSKPSAPFIPKLLASGALHYVVHGSLGTFVWGDNSRGQCAELGKEFKIPHELDIAKLTKLCCGATHTVALTTASVVIVWGDNRNGQCGLPVCDWVAPTPLTLSHVVDITCGDLFTFVIGHESTTGFGKNDKGQLGLGFCSPFEPPTVLPSEPFNGSKIVKMAAGGGFGCAHAMALTEAGALYSWGSGSSGQLGQGVCNLADILVPVYIPAFRGKKVIQFSCGALHSCVLTYDPVKVSVRRENEPGLGTLHKLPDEILNSLFSFISSYKGKSWVFSLLNESDLVRISSCSKFLVEFARKDLLWKSLFRQDFFSLQITSGWMQAYKYK